MRIKHRFGFSRDKDIYNCLDKIGMPYEKGDFLKELDLEIFLNFLEALTD